jgi:hypothetical protein
MPRRDIIRPRPPAEPGARLPPLRTRLAWFAGLSLASCAVVAVVAYALRALPFVGAG